MSEPGRDPKTGLPASREYPADALELLLEVQALRAKTGLSPQAVKEIVLAPDREQERRHQRELAQLRSRTLLAWTGLVGGIGFFVFLLLMFGKENPELVRDIPKYLVSILAGYGVRELMARKEDGGKPPAPPNPP